MSSLIDHGHGNPGDARRAVRWAHLAPFLSWAAVAVAIAFVALFLIQAGLFASLVPSEKIPPPVIANPDQVTSRNSTLSGLDRDNQPYEVTAARAWQDADHSEVLHLETVGGAFRRSTGEKYDVAAREARYDTKLKQLELTGNVVITELNRFTARTEKAYVAVGEKKLTSNVPVIVEFSNGTIRANAIEIVNDGADIVFSGGVKAHFDESPATGETSP
jgi:lipopolysaccharide export system protein LptC